MEMRIILLKLSLSISNPFEVVMKYFELHCHSYFSLGDGVSSPSEIVERATELEYPYIALTDHGEIAGWYDFAEKCSGKDIEPIFGCEFYVAKDYDDLEATIFTRKRGDHPIRIEYEDGSIEDTSTETMSTKDKKVRNLKSGDSHNGKVIKDIYQTRLKRGHLVVLAKGQEGLKSVIKIYNNSWDNYHNKGKKNIVFEKDILNEAGNIVVLSACLGSYIDNEDKVKRFKDTLGEDFYLEIQPHSVTNDFDFESGVHIKVPDKQKSHNEKIIKWSREYDIKTVLTSDPHYPRKEDKTLQDIIILTHKFNRSGWYFLDDCFYMKDLKEWLKYFMFLKLDFGKDDIKKSLSNMYEIGDKCKGAKIKRPPQLREFDIKTHSLYKEGDTKISLIMRIIKDIGRFNNSDEYKKRFKYELSVIKEIGFLDYFLIQEDIIRFNRNNDYLVGTSRGSAGGSLFSYYLGITSIDPIEHGLLFERFLDISRGKAGGLPDIDIDYERQQETQNYIINKYGSEYAIFIGAYQTTKLKDALKKAYKVLYKTPDREYSFDTINKINATFNTNDLDEALVEAKKEFDEAQDKGSPVPEINLYTFLMNKPDVEKAVRKMLKRVNLIRQHACALIISKDPIRETIPVTLSYTKDKGYKAITAFDGNGIEACGQVKFDVLGLNTLNCIKACINEIRKFKGNKLENGIDITNCNNIWDMDLDDPEVLYNFKKADTDTVFQFNTKPLKWLLKMIEADEFNDLSAINALVRPGPLSAGFPQIYAKRKKGELKTDEIFIEEEKKGNIVTKKSKVKYRHPIMDEILKGTYGVMIYQEQIQKIFVRMGGFTLPESNLVRKAVAKKKIDMIMGFKDRFADNVMNNLEPKWTQKQVDDFFEDLIGFGNYCFNKSHSVGYSIIGYVCQYFKTKYPLEWWIGNLKHSGEDGCLSIINKVINENLAPIHFPDINQSKRDFYYDGKKIIIPLRYIDGVGDKCIEEIVNNQPYESIEDFIDKVSGRRVQTMNVINLIICNTFRHIHPDLSNMQLLSRYLDIAEKTSKSKALHSKISRLRHLCEDKIEMARERSKLDKFYINDWVNKFKDFFDKDVVDIRSLSRFRDGKEVIIGGDFIKFKSTKIKRGKNKGNEMCRITVAQGRDNIIVTMWPDVYKVFKDRLKKWSNGGSVVQVKGKVNRYLGTINLICKTMKEIEI